MGIIGGFKAKLQLYTVPGQVFYNSTRKLVLKGVDGIVFVADSQTAMLDANRESIQNLAENLRELGLNLADIPMVFQWNKRDLKQILPVEVLERELNPGRLVSFSAIARSGEGVFETLRGISRLALAQIKRQHLGDAQQAPLPPPEVPAWSRATPPIVPIVPEPAPPGSGLAPLPIAGSLGSDTQPGLRAFPKVDGQAREVPGRDQTLPEALSFLDALPPEPPPSAALPEALSFLDLASGPELFERMWEESELPSVAEPVAESTSADGQVKVMTPLVVKLLPPQPTRPPAPMNFGTTSGSAARAQGEFETAQRPGAQGSGPGARLRTHSPRPAGAGAAGGPAPGRRRRGTGDPGAGAPQRRGGRAIPRRHPRARAGRLIPVHRIQEVLNCSGIFYAVASASVCSERGRRGRNRPRGGTASVPWCAWKAPSCSSRTARCSAS